VVLVLVLVVLVLHSAADSAWLGWLWSIIILELPIQMSPPPSDKPTLTPFTTTTFFVLPCLRYLPLLRCDPSAFNSPQAFKPF
jgi:hypothetical protein